MAKICWLRSRTMDMRLVVDHKMTDSDEGLDLDEHEGDAGNISSSFVT